MQGMECLNSDKIKTPLFNKKLSGVLIFISNQEKVFLQLNKVF